MEHKFVGRNKKISLSQVDLKLFFEFYRDCICPYSYNYLLENGIEIELKFHEEYFSHLLGLHKFKNISFYKNAKDINNNILNNKILFKNLISLEPKKLSDDLQDRVTFFPVLKTLLENTDIALQYDINAAWNTKIRFSFLLKTNKITILVYLAVKKISDNKNICVPVSFLVDRNDRFSKMKLKELKVEKIVISRK